jgi:hypothetical protein
LAAAILNVDELWLEGDTAECKVNLSKLYLKAVKFLGVFNEQISNIIKDTFNICYLDEKNITLAVEIIKMLPQSISIKGKIFDIQGFILELVMKESDEKIRMFLIDSLIEYDNSIIQTDDFMIRVSEHNKKSQSP